MLNKYAISGIKVIGVAKGQSRRIGQETLIDGDNFKKWNLMANDPALHFIQQVRDEAHRFAIEGHRVKRAKTRIISDLDSISGIGPKRKRELLRHFGSATGVKSANIEELQKVTGINSAIAHRIYDHCNGG